MTAPAREPGKGCVRLSPSPTVLHTFPLNNKPVIGNQVQKVPSNLLRSVVYHAWIWSASGEGVGEWEWDWESEEEVRLSLEVPPKQLQQSAAGTHPAEREREQWQQYVCQHICQQYTTHSSLAMENCQKCKNWKLIIWNLVFVKIQMQKICEFVWSF